MKAILSNRKGGESFSRRMSCKVDIWVRMLVKIECDGKNSGNSRVGRKLEPNLRTINGVVMGQTGWDVQRC